MSQSPIDLAVNPNDPAQRYILWTNGRVDAVGGAPPITSGPDWSDRVDTVGMALQITNWTTGAGYILDWQGGFNTLNGAPDLMTQTQDKYKSVPGVPYQTFRCYIDWSWDPSGTGRGYALDLWGQIYAFGGAVACPRAGARFTSDIARRLRANWSGGAVAGMVTMDMHGGLYGDFGIALETDLDNTYDPTRDWARDLRITTWTSSSVVAGYTLGMTGILYPFQNAPTGGAPGGVYQNADVARAFEVISAANPTEIWQVWSGGQQFDYVFSTAPSVTAGGAQGYPASPTTDTTRPTLAWSYNDAQGDAQIAWECLVFTQDFANTHDMSDPTAFAAEALVAVEGSQVTTRGIICPVDLDNGDYRMFIRAEDSSTKWSAWSTRDWTQDVATPDTPTALTATAENDTLSVALSVSASSANNGALVRFEYSEDGGASWTGVRGADAVPLAATTTAHDYDAPLGLSRLYRASVYNTAPAVASGASGTAAATVTRMVYALTSVADPTLGGEVFVVSTPTFTRTAVAGSFQGIGAEYQVVVSDGIPKGRKETIGIECDTAEQWALAKALIESDSVLVYRNPFGEVVYCRIVGDLQRAQQRFRPYPDEITPLRNNHIVTIPVIQIAQPD